MSKQSDIKKIIKGIKKQGWEVVRGGSHYKATHPNGNTVTISVSPSCSHAVANITNDIKKAEK